MILIQKRKYDNVTFKKNFHKVKDNWYNLPRKWPRSC